MCFVKFQQQVSGYNIMSFPVKELFFSLNDAAWHGACLALAEMCRRGCLLPCQLKAVISAIVSALAYNQLRASYSIGSNVRDAASYAAWSLARNFHAEHMSSEVN